MSWRLDTDRREVRYGIFGRLVEAKRSFLYGPKMAPRWPQDGPKGPEEDHLERHLGALTPIDPRLLNECWGIFRRTWAQGGHARD